MAKYILSFQKCPQEMIPIIIKMTKYVSRKGNLSFLYQDLDVREGRLGKGIRHP